MQFYRGSREIHGGYCEHIEYTRGYNSRRDLFQYVNACQNYPYRWSFLASIFLFLTYAYANSQEYSKKVVVLFELIMKALCKPTSVISVSLSMMDTRTFLRMCSRRFRNRRYQLHFLFQQEALGENRLGLPIQTKTRLMKRYWRKMSLELEE
jgi:hypothetical protein